MMKLCCLVMTLERAWRRQRLSLLSGDINLDQPTTVLSQLNVWLNDKGKVIEQGVQLRKRKMIIPMWKIIEASELVKKTVLETTRLRILDPMKAIPHDDMVKLLKLCWEWHHNLNTLIWWLYLIRKRQQDLEVVEISDWTTTDVFFMVPVCGMDWQNAYNVYAPCMLTKYKHWVALMIDLVKGEIKVYDSMVSLIRDEILKEELVPLSITIPNLLNTIDFYEEECVDVPQQSNQ
ncbi:hypothetical protein L3X38_027893 [Prunus dulcis]|uniref:Ubiquitin-like protease family profile domain-containing protein n=1 Tax=Prunus dulcis TaxID=3755 RepID=A0AAD4VPM9_PRUDU|nr:hypothetical protein L3X38_027893 [Prunus dulcis]